MSLLPDDFMENYMIVDKINAVGVPSSILFFALYEFYLFSDQYSFWRNNKLWEIAKRMSVMVNYKNNLVNQIEKIDEQNFKLKNFLKAY